MPLSQKQLEDVCLFYEQDSRTCRYLAEDDQDSNKMYCMKLNAQKKAAVDAKVKNFINTCHGKGINPSSVGDPIGNNCAGYPILKHIEQGYDKD